MALLVLGDVGGTKSNFRLQDLDSSGFLAEQRFRTCDYSSVLELIRTFLDKNCSSIAKNRIAFACISVCGPVTAGCAPLVGPHFGPEGWLVDEAELSSSLKLKVPNRHATPVRQHLVNPDPGS
jgi:glucokinase